ncbi:CotH kinase family protein [Phocaeicola plebeius]|uniref:CotH kinase family protein n=1 Tax=Phocaeicola plebeius TaxID=310297 RepID=UPI0022DF7CB4|nr:CotH kinase family protein [Phocaeicola plebeius]
MTNEEKQEIISSVIQSLQTNSATIDQLSEVESCSEGDFIELNKGRKISAENLAKDVSSKVLQEANQAVAESQNYAEKSEESANESEEYSEKSKEYSEEAKRQAVLAGQSGELAQYAKEQGDYAKEQGDNAKEKGEEAVSIAEDAAKRVTNDVLFKTEQSLSEEEQAQVLKNIGIKSVVTEYNYLDLNSIIINFDGSNKYVTKIPCTVPFFILSFEVRGEALLDRKKYNVIFLQDSVNKNYSMNLEAINPYLTGRIVANEEESDPGVLTLKCSGVESSNPDYNRITLTSACYPSDYVSKFKGNFESEEVLQSVRGTIGCYAFVGNPRHIYNWDTETNKWKDGGELITITDKELSEDSDRPVANSTLFKKFNEIEKSITDTKKELSDKIDENIFFKNVSKNGERLDLVSAVNLVPEELRIHGFEVRYLSDDGSWIDVTFTGDSIENWSTESNWKQISGGGTGSGFYNVSVQHPLIEGYYTIETALQAIANDKIDDEDKKGKIITFEVSAGKWEDYRFSGTSIESWLEPSAWERFGGGDAIKKIKVTKGISVQELTPDEHGQVDLEIPVVEVDQAVNENSTNPVSGKAVFNELKKNTGSVASGIQLNEIGEGDQKVYSISLLNAGGEVISTTDQFSGAGGGSSLATKVILTRVTANKTVKIGDDVKLTYKYDHVNSETGESTGNPAKAIVTIIQGANTNTLESNIYAGSSNTVDVTKYMGVGTNTVRVKVQVGEGAEMQVSQITWTINVVQLTLSSSFNIATSINRGDSVTIPYALSGAGNKTLRCYVDGVDKEDRSITASTANGSFSIDTSGMSHGTHSVQLVVELELSEDNIIKSNSIYFAIGVRETDNNAPIVYARFDYPDGSLILGENTPYIQTKQFDVYTLSYAAYNPKETPTNAIVYVGEDVASSSSVPFVVQNLTLRASNYGEQKCRIVVGKTEYSFRLIAEKSELNISEPTDGMTLKLSAQGRNNNDVNREEWSYNGIQTVFEGFKWGGDGWIGNALRLNDKARAVVQYAPLRQPDQNVTNAFAFAVKYKVSEVVDDEAELIRCVDGDGTGFVITAQEARMQTKGKSSLSMKMASGEVYEVMFVSFPKSASGSSEYEKLNTEMVYLYINGIMSGSVQRSASDSIYQSDPQFVTMGADGATLDVYLLRAYNTYLSDSQILDCYMIDQDSVDDMFALYESNNVIDDNGNVTVDSVPDGMRYIIITGRQDNGVPTVLQAAVNNDKDPKYDVDEMLCVVKGNQSLNFKCVGGCIRLQGTSSLAYPIKNYRIYFKNASKVAGDLYLCCDEQGVGGELQEEAKYSFRQAGTSNKAAAPVDCFCLKADFAESSSSHNTGMAKIVQNILTAAGELTPAQAHCSGEYGYDVRTTIDGEPCYLFYRGTLDETPQFLGKFNFNNDKSTEAVFGFCDIPGYHDQSWVADKFSGVNPTECWEFLNNDYPMGMFLDDDFDTKGDDGTPNWLKVFEARFPDDDDINAEYEAGTRKPKYLEPLVKWVKSTQNDGEKFKAELADWFDVDYLCDYYMFTEIMGCVDQRVKNMMMGFWYDPEKDKVLAYMIFYDCDTILGVRNDGRLKYSWDVDENTVDPELSTEEKTVYAYAGHDSVLWKNLREQFPEELQAAYRRIRERMSNSTIFKMFDDEQSAKFCERIYNLDALNKYVEPKTLGVEVNQDGSVTNVKYSYLEAMQGSRKSHRHWWITNRMGLFDARYSTGQYTATDISFKGNSAAGATVKATPLRDFYFEFRREGDTMVHQKVTKDVEWSYTYNQMANIGTIFHLYGGEWMKKLDLSAWGGFTDMSLPTLPVLEELILGGNAKTYALTELVLGTKIPMLRKLEVVNYTNLPSLDLSGCNRLEEVNASGCTKMSTITFAEGALINKLHLPENFQTLVLRSMQYIEWDAITFDAKNNLTGLWIENCALIDGKKVFDEMFALKGALKYVRITGINLEGDGSDLKVWYDSGIGGIDAQGITTNTRCKLVGNYKLTKYLDEEVYAKYAERFDELNIRQPQYTMIEFDDTVPDDANISNLDNETGYKFGNTYQTSAHISVIRRNRHRVLGKLKSEGKMVICQLHDEDSNYYADAEVAASGTPAKLDSTEGDVYIYEPHYWYKGINDYLNNKKYSCFSSNEEMPDRSECKVIGYDEIESEKNVREGYKLTVGRQHLDDAYSQDSNYLVCKVNVFGYKKVRFPTVLGTSMIGSCFTDSGKNVVKDVFVDSLNNRFVNGMYIICDVPEGATELNFTIHKYAEFDCVVLSNSDKIEDMEPDWVEHEPCLVAVFEACTIGSKLYSAATGNASVCSLTQSDFVYYAKQRGLQLIDWEMHKDIANLFFAFYGRRDSQDQCGYGQSTEQRNIGTTALLGMQDTISYNSDGGAHQTSNAWYVRPNEDGKNVYSLIYNTNCMGYENLYGDKYEWLSGVSLPNTNTQEQYKLLIEMPDGSTRKVKSGTVSGYCTGMYHQKYMDIVGVHSQKGSSTTYYCDEFNVSNAANRVVCRSNNYSFADGGVSCAFCGVDSSSSFTGIGSRLAFRGEIEEAESVTAFKAIKAILA